MDIYKRENKAYFIYNELNRQHFFSQSKKQILSSRQLLNQL